MARPYSYRRHQRYVHGKRRIDQDRAQHGGRQLEITLHGEIRRLCECFSDDVDRGRGAVFARFADTPHPERDPWKAWEPLPWEKKAPKAGEWD